MNFRQKTHNLLRLFDITKLAVTAEDIRFLEELNQFQMDTRYPDGKFSLYKMAIPDFTSERITKVENLKKWLESQI